MQNLLRENMHILMLLTADPTPLMNRITFHCDSIINNRIYTETKKFVFRIHTKVIE